MRRVPEPELMDEPEQARAYAEADFSEPNALFVALFQESFPDFGATGCLLDLGCGPADITLRLARAYPACRVHGVDGARRMLAFGHDRIAATELEGRVTLVHGVIPQVRLPRGRYEAVVSNSLLHHLHDAAVLWETIKRCAAPGAPVLVMDLARPQSAAQVDDLVRTYAGDAPPVLQRDFRWSLCAAFRPEEVLGQLAQAGLGGFDVRMVSDRHLAVLGRVPDPKGL
ncbi:MAG: methyltransferase domain-containing protein [Gammaproteobacteria bacterium]|nr:methyltransferase domain-containing protein [Gammaproteobacteria bacterium]NIR83312.1 methyltransferase domain-containing protein [Gammaproteobacteria bacterium]NIR91112.1 methyltransferase domain-containing protein [Gammaproteobacteria bacterium]NIU04479.1 methyltransferase domain-containing protein [Gammaproteobacteria bacterium]NIW87115.1 methyltransferase domain-containing protein [Gammaproteobacteria bacterium]